MIIAKKRACLREPVGETRVSVTAPLYQRLTNMLSSTDYAMASLSNRMALNSAFKQRCEEARTQFREAETLAEMLDQPVQQFMVAYRLTTSPDEKITYDTRRRELIAIIEAMQPFERHEKTSQFLLESHLDAASIVTFLAVAIDASTDGIDVVPIDLSRAVRVGRAHFQ